LILRFAAVAGALLCCLCWCFHQQANSIYCTVNSLIKIANMNNPVFALVDNYINQLYNHPDAALENTEAAIAASGIPSISVSPNQGKFLHLLARLCQAKKILEIGTLGGYSTIWMARALPSDGRLVSLELEQQHADVAQQNIAAAGLDHLVAIRVGKAIDWLPKMMEAGEGPFDMIFIDADKPPYTEYLEWSLKLSRPGTLIVADNVIRDGKVLDPGCTDEMVTGAQRFNQALANCKAVTATILQTVGEKEHDGMALAIVN
jgi:caffeoyl-CoA O-methyltransferase